MSSDALTRKSSASIVVDVLVSTRKVTTMSNSLTISDIESTAWDLNFFFREDWDGRNSVWDEFYTCQPSLYINTIDNRSLRYYLESFSCNMQETVDIANGLGYTDSDFFIDADLVMPHLSSRIKTLLDLLPKPIDVVEGRSQIDSMVWIN